MITLFSIVDGYSYRTKHTLSSSYKEPANWLERGDRVQLWFWIRNIEIISIQMGYQVSESGISPCKLVSHLDTKHLNVQYPIYNYDNNLYSKLQYQIMKRECLN